MNQESQLPAFLYGESIFTTIKVVNGNAVDLSEHIDKLFLDAVGYFNVENLSTLERKLKNELKISDFTGALRITIFANTRDSLTSTFCEDDLNFCFSTRKIDFSKNTEVTLKLIERVQAPELCQFKVGSYGKELWLKRKLNEQAIDDALYFGNGKVFETTTSNIFFVKDNLTFTPKSGIYKGLTRKKIKAIEKDILVEDILNYDEIYIGNSLFEKIKVKKIIN